MLTGVGPETGFGSVRVIDLLQEAGLSVVGRWHSNVARKDNCS